MGLFVGYLAYRHGKKKAERRAHRNAEWETDAECDVCGYLESQHDVLGRCPSYG
jgi:ribosomal protein L32